MSNFPMIEDPKRAVENLLNSIISLNPAQRKASILPLLTDFLAHPIIKPILDPGQAPAMTQASPPNKDLLQIHQTLSSLSKAIENIQKKFTPPSNNPPPPPAQRGKDKAHTSPCTYLAVAGSRPPNPSIVVDLANLGDQIVVEPWPDIICRTLNQRLQDITLPQVHLAAVRWTQKGNLVITRAHPSTPQTLHAAVPHIMTLLNTAFGLSTKSQITQIRANVKWSKILINSVPTGGPDSAKVYSPDTCHTSLTANNPSYATLTIMQKPSWVHSPTSYKPNSISSLSVAFEDPDGSKLKTILAECYLYACSMRASVKKWKYRQNITKDNSEHPAVTHTQDRDNNSEEDTDHTPAQPPIQSPHTCSPTTTRATQPARSSNRKTKPSPPIT